jgi:hypothetical protein
MESVPCRHSKTIHHSPIAIHIQAQASSAESADDADFAPFRADAGK